VPLRSIPTAAGSTCSVRCTPSISRATSVEPAQIPPHQFRQPPLGPDHKPLARCTLTDAVDPDSCGNGSSEFAWRRAKTPATFCSKARPSSASRELHVRRLGKLNSCPSILRARGHWIQAAARYRLTRPVRLK